MGLFGCSNNAPTPERFHQNLERIPDGKLIAAIAEKNYQAPQAGQIIDKTVVYKTVDNTYNKDGSKLLIPRDSVITGDYSNDGVDCTIIWKAIYFNKREYRKHHGIFALKDIAKPNQCNPTTGIKAGSQVFIMLTNWNAWLIQE